MNKIEDPDRLPTMSALCLIVGMVAYFKLWFGYPPTDEHVRQSVDEESISNVCFAGSGVTEVTLASPLLVPLSQDGVLCEASKPFRHCYVHAERNTEHVTVKIRSTGDLTNVTVDHFPCGAGKDCLLALDWLINDSCPSAQIIAYPRPIQPLVTSSL